MTTYYVRKSGSDAAAGTSAGAAWATVGKAVGASGMATGDTCYVGGGIYREALTLTLAPTTATYVIGDVTGAFTGDAGEVRITSYIATDLESTASTCLTWTSKNYYNFSNIIFQSTWGSPVCTGAIGHDCTYTDCAFVGGTICASAVAVDVAANITFRRCMFFWRTTNGIALTLPSSTTADYDTNILFENCLLYGTSTNTSSCIVVSPSGANTFKGGGIRVRSCTLFGNQCVTMNSSTLLSTTYPCTIYDSVLFSNATALVGGLTGQLIEDHNVIIATTARTNTTAGTHTSASSTVGPLFEFGQSRIYGAPQRQFGTPVADNQVLQGFGSQASPPALDLFGLARPDGVGRTVATGTATSATATTLTNTGATLGNNAYNGATLKITGGTGSGQVKTIKSHTPTVVTVFGNFVTTPDSSSTYSIYFGIPAENFQCTSGSTTTAVQSTASWTTNMFVGFTMEVRSGTGSGQSTTVTSNTGTTLTVPTLGTALDSTSVVWLYRQTSEAAVNNTAGAMERHDFGGDFTVGAVA